MEQFSGFALKRCHQEERENFKAFGDRTSSLLSLYPHFDSFTPMSAKGNLQYLETRKALIIATEPMTPVQQRASAIKEFLSLNFTYVPALFVFGIGILLGIGLVIKIIKVCLEKKRSATVYLILGLMIGSLYAIIMGPKTLEVPRDALNIHTFNIIMFIIGGVVVMGLEKIKNVLKEKHIEG